MEHPECTSITAGAFRSTWECSCRVWEHCACSREVWKRLEVIRSTGDIARRVWEDCVWLPDRIAFCWCLWTHTDIQCLRHQGCEGLGPLLWYKVSWSSHHSPHFIMPADVAALQEQEFTFSGLVGSIPLIYRGSVWHDLRPSDQLEVGQATCLWGWTWSLQSADNQLGKRWMHQQAFLSVR